MFKGYTTITIEMDLIKHYPIDLFPVKWRKVQKKVGKSAKSIILDGEEAYKPDDDSKKSNWNSKEKTCYEGDMKDSVFPAKPYEYAFEIMYSENTDDAWRMIYQD